MTNDSINLLTPPTSVDGFVVNINDRILVWKQSIESKTGYMSARIILGIDQSTFLLMMMFLVGCKFMLQMVAIVHHTI
jgi:hypothetical protein